MKYYKDFLKLEVFTFKEAQQVVGSVENTKAILNSYVKKGLLKKVRRGLYCVVNLDNEKAPADRYLIGSKLNEEAYLAYHTAFEVHGLSHQVSFVVFVASKKKISDFTFEGVTYKYVGPGITEGVIRYRFNKEVKITDLERTVADSINRLDYSGGPHELDEILKICPVLDENKLLKYLEAYDKNILYKKAGYFLERHQQTLNVDDSLLNLLEKRAGEMKSYLCREATRGGGMLKKRWGLIVPKTLEKEDEVFV